MLAERPQIERALEQVFSRESLTPTRKPTEHAGGKWRLSYTTALGRRGHLEVDVTFMLRAPLWPVAPRDSHPIGGISATNIPVLDTHELAAGKLAAQGCRRSSKATPGCSGRPRTSKLSAGKAWAPTRSAEVVSRDRAGAHLREPRGRGVPDAAAPPLLSSARSQARCSSGARVSRPWRSHRVHAGRPCRDRGLSRRPLQPPVLAALPADRPLGVPAGGGSRRGPGRAARGARASSGRDLSRLPRRS